MGTQTLREQEPTLSVVGLGCNNFGMKIDEDTSAAVIGAALDAGVTHFDTAEMYGGGKSEEFLGRALVGRRDEAFLATKFSPLPKEAAREPGALAARAREALEQSLGRLGTDHVDLYYQHYADPAVPVEEVVEVMQAFVDEGKVRHGARSNLDPADLEAGAAVTDAVQIEWSLLNRDVESTVVPVAERLGIGVVPYFPLASGLLTGKYRKGEPFPQGSRLDAMSYFAGIATDDNMERVERLLAFAEGEGHTLLELAVAWLAAQPSVVSVICGATSPEQVRANATAASWELTPDQLAAVDACLTLD